MLRIVIVSTEKHWARQVAAIFPEWEMHVEQLHDPRLLLPATSRWDALVLDLDLAEAHTSNLAEFMETVVSGAGHTVVLIPPRLMHLEPQFAGTGIFVLRKPTSSGEIALALRMLLKGP